MTYKSEHLNSKYTFLSHAVEVLTSKLSEVSGETASIIQDDLKKARAELSDFEYRNRTEPMIALIDSPFEDGFLTDVIHSNSKNASTKPTYFQMNNGKLRRPVFNDKEKETVISILDKYLPEGFNGRVLLQAGTINTTEGLKSQSFLLIEPRDTTN